MRIWVVCFFLLFAFNAKAAESYRGLIRVAKNQQLYVDYKSAKKGSPTLVILNGLTYSVESWDSFTHAIERAMPDAGILLYDMKGMGRSLLSGRLPVNYAIPYTDQVEQLKALLEILELKKVHLLGLSYGGGIGVAFTAKYPKAVENLILMAPFTEPLEDQDKLIRLQVAAARAANPFNPATDDELYDYFLRQFVYSTYPSAEPVVLENPFKLEAVFRMVQGIRKFHATKLGNKMPNASVHLMVANQDQYLPQNVLDRYWESLPSGARASRINISFSEHKIPEAIPNFSAAWVAAILQKHPEIHSGRVFDGNTLRFNARTGSIVVPLEFP